MHYKPLPIGVDNFEKLITKGYYYVDKTAFIKDLLDMKGDVNLFTRPRRFGKTLNMSMLQYFFEDMRNSKGESIDNSGIFSGLRIMQAGEKYLSHMGKYPVITLTLKAGKQSTFESAYKQLIWQISMEFERHSYLLDSDMSDEMLERYKSILGGYANLDVFKASIQFLSGCLEKYYGKKVIILIDEYDVPLENAFVCGFYDKMIDFIRALFESALKTNSSLDFAVITGCLRISKESIFTGLN
ncbi:MAG: AAA family ATPase, partial [Lachnospiraceae bacterium]|nr:AAA family ATPase [Lachnospiraceae bacterium]